ncbi:MAG: deoxyguanosinetriphosphate triphosphohydrolase [Firmicutes bacterium]|nr:deoxyguanosinetriphosphate triphosphohydrolase [Candidatus Caballimonas caccae]
MKDKTLKIEEMFLSKYAKKSCDTIGRLYFEEPCPMRTEFQRDRDRIIHSKAFRRLKNKTQVFFNPEGDHYRTRLTHTLNVSQIARSIARALSLNEDLTEAIALGHDLGHTPFGHSGERILNKLNPHGFEHNIQSGRVVDVLEHDGEGLNLTREVVDGIINHKKECNPMTLEGKAVSIADRIAYLNHDIDDAIESGFIVKEDLPKDLIEILGDRSSTRINKMIYSIYKESDGKNQVKMEKEVDEATNKLRDYLFQNVYNLKTFRDEEEKATRMISSLYEYFKKNVDEMPKFYVGLLDKYDIDTVLSDYISSMSDGFVIKIFTEKFIPNTWKD